MLNFGNHFFIISMLIDKVMMIISRYGGLALSLFISFVLSSYCYFIIEYNFQSLIDYNLFNRPELVVKYFWGILKNYYYNRSQMPLSFTVKILFILVIPYLFVKLMKAGLQFTTFFLAMKLQHKMPTISQFILRKTAFATTIGQQNNLQKKQKLTTTINNNQNVQNPQQSIKPKINLRK